MQRHFLIFSLLAIPSLVFAEQAASPITVVKVEAKPVITTLELTGSITAKRQARLSSRTSGLIQKLLVDAGSTVKAGDVLMELDPTLAQLALDRVKAESEQAAAELAEAKRQIAEVRDLAKVGAFSKSEAETRETAVRVQTANVNRSEVSLREQKEIIVRHKLVAPFDGVIRQKFTEEGEWVQTGAPVVELVETGRVNLDIQVPQEWTAAMSGNPEITVKLDAHANTVFKARIAAQVPVKDPVARTFLLRLELDDPQLLASPGMSARVQFTFTSKENSVQIPRDAMVLFPDGTAKVWIIENNGDNGHKAVSRQVKPGLTVSDNIVILEGLEVGLTLALEGNEGLREGQPVHIVK